MPLSGNDWIATTAAGAASIAASISAWAWAHTHGLIGKKAEAAEVEKLLKRFETGLSEQRHDNQRIFDEIKSVTTAFHLHVEKVAEELGKRPTRSECAAIWHRSDNPS